MQTIMNIDYRNLTDKQEKYQKQINRSWEILKFLVGRNLAGISKKED